MDGEDLALFTRSIRKATQEQTGPALDAALEEIGWSDALTSEPRDAIATLFTCQGADNATSSALGRVVLHALGLDDTPEVGVVLPAIGQWLPAGTVDANGLQVRGLVPADLRSRQSALVIASAGHADHAYLVPTTSLALDRIGGIDPQYGLWHVAGVDLQGTSDLGPTATPWTSAVALARLAIAHELVGAARTMLELAREHALGRTQFGRSISSFQAIRHRLAETLVAVEMADAMLDAAWLDGTEDTAAMAKARSRSAGTYGRSPLSAGAGRDRLHQRASAAPLAPADDPPGRPVRDLGVAHQEPRRADRGHGAVATPPPTLTTLSWEREGRR